MDTIPDELLSALHDRYGISGRAEPLAAGTSDSLLWQLDSAPPVLVRVSRHYTLPDLQRACRVAREFSRMIPETIPPLVAPSGEAAFLWNGQPVTVWPFVNGQNLD
ncbi:MAG TPA: hypothetical protein VHX39_22095, partial [Acetobacteraceae bacterium]|nr:hypothetical protein [Acetobacteraceae bacterium]